MKTNTKLVYGMGWPSRVLLTTGRSGRGWASAGMVAVVTALLAPGPALAQVGNPAASAGVVVEGYRFSADETVGLRSIRLTTLPFSAGVDLLPSLRLQIGGAFASGELERADGSSARLSGLTDTEVQLQASMGADRLRFGGIFVLPTGHTRYSSAEAEVAGIVAGDVLPFRITNWGSGGGFGAHSSLAGTVGDFGLGVSTSYLVGREFEVFAGEEALFRPGGQLTVALAADRNIGRAGKAALQLRMTRYGEDALAGSNLYRSGLRYQALGSYAFAAPRYSSAIAYAGVMHRTQGTFLVVPDSVASQNLLMAGGVMRIPFDWGVLVPAVELQALRRADGTGQGYTASVGGSAERAVAGLVLAPSIRARFGQVVVFEGARSGFTGLEFSLTTRFGRSGS